MPQKDHHHSEYVPCDNLNNGDNDEYCNQQEDREDTTGQSPSILSSPSCLLLNGHADWYWRSLLAGPIGWRRWSAPLRILRLEFTGGDLIVGVTRWFAGLVYVCCCWVGGRSSVGGIHDRR